MHIPFYEGVGTRSCFLSGAALKTEILPVTPGVRLVPVSITDVDALVALVSENRAYLAAFMPKVVTLDSLDSAQQYLLSVVDSNGKGELLEWHIFSGDTLCGAIRLNHIEIGNRNASIGYYIGSEHQGAGLATSSVRAVLEYAYERLGFHRIELRCASGNLPSQRLAERLGFSWEGLLRQTELIDDVYIDHFVYGLLRPDFEARAAVLMKEAA